MSQENSNSGLPSSSNGTDYSSLPRGAIGRKGLPVARNARLPSFRMPRDLTLGGTPKKTFVPNIPVRREKSDKPNVASECEMSPNNTRGGQRDDRGRGRGRDRNRNRHELIQTQGVFSEASTEAPRRNSTYSGHNFQREKSSSAKTIIMPPVKKEFPERGDQSVLDEIMRDDFIDDDYIEDYSLAPVKLPLCRKQPKDFKNVPPLNVKNIKTEPGVISENHLPENATVVEKKNKVYELFTNSDDDEGKLIFFQLPDCLPLSPPEESDAGSSRQGQNGPNVQASGSDGHSLGELSEGLFGKLLLMQSGKVKLVVGETTLDVTPGISVNYLQDLISVRTDGNGGDMAMLGHVDDNIICSPNIEDLLKQWAL